MPWIGIESLRNRVDVPCLSFVGGRLEFYEAGVLVDRLVGGIWPERKVAVRLYAFSDHARR